MNSGKYGRKMKKRGKKEKRMTEARKRGFWSEIGRRTRIQQARNDSAGEIYEW